MTLQGPQADYNNMLWRGVSHDANRKMMGVLNKRRGQGACSVRDNLSMPYSKIKNAIVKGRIVVINSVMRGSAVSMTPRKQTLNSICKT